MITVYQISRLEEGEWIVRYVGQTLRPLRSRLYGHESSKGHFQHQAIKAEALLKTEDKRLANYAENFWIKANIECLNRNLNTSPISLPDTDLFLIAEAESLNEVIYSKACNKAIVKEIAQSQVKIPIWNILSKEQRKAVKFAIQRGSAGIFAEPGVGKSHITLSLIEELKAKKCLIFCRLTNLQSTWITLIQKHLPGYRLVDNLDDLIASGDPAIYLTNFAKFTSKFSGPNSLKYRRTFKKLTRVNLLDFVAIDESQDIKNGNSRASHVACSFKAKHRFALTGTPMDQHPSELWAQMKFIEPEAFGTSWKEFDFEYLTQPSVDPYLYPPGSAKFRQMLLVARIQRAKAGLRPEMADSFNEILHQHCIYVDKSSLNLPPAIDHEIVFELSAKERKAYDQMEKHSVLEAGGSIIKGALAITKSLKLAQIPGGYIIDEDGELHSIGGFSKARQLEKLVPKLRRPFLVFALYRHELEMIHELLVDLGLEVRTLSGAVHKRDRPALLQAFQNSEFDALVIQNKTGGVGVDLFEACDSVIYSQSHSRIDDQQMRARIERRGQLRRMRFFYLVANDTIDADKREAIRTKGKLTSITLNRLKRKFPLTL